MKKTRHCLLGALVSLRGWCSYSLATSLLFFVIQVKAQTAVAPFVVVNGEPQSALMADLLLKEQLSRGAVNSLELQASVRLAMIQQGLMAQEAVKEGLDKQPGTQAQLGLARQNVLAQAWQQKFLQSVQLQESELKEEYRRQIQLLGPKEYRVRHLLVQEEATAKLLLEKVRAGTRIADLAVEYSRDESTKSKGGLTEWTPQGQFFPSIAKAVESLQPGQWVPTPVSSPAGWHVVQLDQSRAFIPPVMDKVKPELVQALLQKRLQEKMEQLRQKAKIE